MQDSQPLTIGVSTLGGGGWLGGVNYILNVVQALVSLPISKRPRIRLVVRERELTILDQFSSIFPFIDKLLICGPVQPSEKIVPIKTMEAAFEYIDFLYPILATVLDDPTLPAGSWITDFQHKHLPNFFSRKEIDNRNHSFQDIASKARHVVFSSKTALHDFERFFPDNHATKHVLRFTSSMDPGLLLLEPNAIAHKHGLNMPYLICCNQFWAHKDHLTAFRAMSLLKKSGLDVTLACTGGMNDYRNPDYFPSLLTQVESLGIQNNIIFLGELPRSEQVALIRGSLAMLQPSLFEGWSTVVEDARSLGKTIFLTDLPVHREQNPEYAIYFPAGNANALAEKVASTYTDLFEIDSGSREATTLLEMENRRLRFGLELVNIAKQSIAQTSAKQKKINPSRNVTKSYRVSAIVSTYNSEQFIEGCLKDLLAQSMYVKEELEIIVIDSASPQNEGDIVKNYAKKHPHIVYLRTDERETLYAAWNRGIRMARGIYVTNANTDDRHHPEALERLATTLDTNPESMLAYAHCKVSVTPNATWTECNGDEVYRYPFYSPPLCLLHYMFGPQPLWRKEIHERIGEFDPTLFAVGDLDFNIRFCLAGLKAVLVPEVLGLFLKSATSITSSFPRQAQEKAMIMRKWRHSENVLKLFEAGGHHATSPMDQASLLNDFAIDAMSYTTPWNRHESAPILALDCMASALTLAPENTVIQKNFRTMKSTMTKSTQTRHTLQKLRPQIDTPFGHSSTAGNETRPQQRNTQSPKKHVISFFAGQTDHFHFIKPWFNHFVEHGYAVQIIKTKDIQHKGLHYFLNRCDLAWFEWGNGHIVEASQLPKTCKMVCRVHRYEVYQHRMAQVNWSNVDYAIFVNARFIDEYKLVSGIDPRKSTNTIEIPNPLLPSTVFHDRVPGFNIAHISRFHADKNPLFALQILAALVQRDNRYKLYMIGGVQDTQLYHSCLDFVAKQNLRKNFIYDGIKDDVENWLLDKSFILSTSIVESQGMAILEAMRQGVKPIIYSGFGMERTFAPEHMFRLPEEATNMIYSQNYDSWSYRKEALARFDAKGILQGIDQITRDLFANTPHRASGIDAGHAVRQFQSASSKQPRNNEQATLRNRLDEMGWGHRLELYSQVLDRVEQKAEFASPAMSIVLISWRLHPDTIKSFKILKMQKDSNFELIFVDNGGSPGEFDCLSPYIDTYIRLNSNSGAYLARNIGSIFAKSPILFFLDDDAIPADNIIESHLNCFKNYDVIAVRGVCKPKTNNPLNQLAKHYYLGPKPFPIYADIEGNTSYLASAFFKAGGWDDEIRFGGGGVDLSRRLIEIDFDMRKQIYSPDPIIFHDYATDNNHLAQKIEKQEHSRSRLRTKHPDYDDFLARWKKLRGKEELLILKSKHLEKIKP